MQQSVLKLITNSLSAHSKNYFQQFRTLRTLSLAMPIKAGDKLPPGELFEGTPAGKVDVAELVRGKKVLFFGVPGAFTPGCTKTHLPGYITEADNIRKKGIDEIVCVSVNDPFVMAAWGEANNAAPKVRMLADTTGDFSKSLDLTVDMSKVLGGVRSKRYSMLVEDGVVKAIDVEPDGTGLTCSLANNFLKKI